MIRAAIVVLVVTSGCFLQTPVMRFGGARSQELQRQEMGRRTPPVLVANGTWTGEVRVVRIRVWADEEFRAQHVKWKEAFAPQLAYANEVLGPLVGIELEAEYRAWGYRAEPGAPLEATLDALVAQDAGDDVFAVVALTSSIALVSGDFEQIGLAKLGGRHMVLRGYADLEEREVFERAFGDLSEDEREYLYALRRRHKEASLLLHELAHTLGVPHENEADTLMNPSYSDRSSSFTAHSRDLMLAAVEARLAGPAAAPAEELHPTLVIRIDATGAVSIAGVVLTAGSLTEMLRMTREDDRETKVVIRAATGAPLEIVDRVARYARGLGLARISTEVGD